MSKIFEALRQSENHTIIQVIEGEQATQPEAPASTYEPDFIVVSEEPPPPSEDPTVSVALSPVEITSGQGYRIVEMEVKAGLPILPFDGTDHRTAECYRIARTNILHHPAKPKVIVITSAGPGEGKTTSSINIPGALALKPDCQVLLVDADLRRGSIASMLGIPSSPGLVEVLTGEYQLNEAIVQTENLPNLFVLPAGDVSSNPTELLDSPAWREMVQHLREQFQFVIVDTTPVGIVADYHLVQRVSDGTIMIMRPDQTNRADYTAAMQHVLKGTLLGVLLNCAEEWALWKIRGYRGYYQRESGRSHRKERG